ncbi:branched-chain amino acid aminotransferase [Phlyctema vagabunda]|uniref:Branched-chain amino acid aminotransferase n=1 Tax=Phlyctema vagabunda TaxID=108571 RepID=A0ABR4PUJ9_9HELO
MAFPRPPRPDINWDALEFKIWEVNGHVESTYEVDTNAWSQPRFVHDPMQKIHGLAPALNYGQQAFEGLKAYRDSAGKINVFRPQKHAARMIHSAGYVSIPAPPEELFLASVKLAVSLNTEFVPPHGSSALLYIRPLIFGSGAHLGLSPPRQFKLCVYVQPMPNYHGAEPVDGLVLDDFDRAATKGTGSAKVGGNYAPVMRWSERARADHFAITLHLDSKTASEIDEFSTSAFLGLRKHEAGDGYTAVMPDSRNIVQSVTSDSCQALARSFGWDVEKRPVPYGELAEFTEVLALGTAAAIVPIRSISRKSTCDKFVYIDEGKGPGPGFERLLSAYDGIVKGKIEDPFGWLEEVPEIPASAKSVHGSS